MLVSIILACIVGFSTGDKMVIITDHSWQCVDIGMIMLLKGRVQNWCVPKLIILRLNIIMRNNNLWSDGTLWVYRSGFNKH